MNLPELFYFFLSSSDRISDNFIVVSSSSGVLSSIKGKVVSRK